MSVERWRAPLVRVLKYGGVDAVLFPFNISIAWALTAIGVDYRLATAAGFFSHVTVAFFLNRKWTFHSQVHATSGLVKTWLIGAGDLALAVTVTTVLVEYVGLAFLYARVGAALIVFAWAYVLNSILTFKTSIFH